MNPDTPPLDDLFDIKAVFPDADAKERLGLLVGIDDQRRSLAKVLSFLVNPSGLLNWATRHHRNASETIEQVLRRPPLVVLSGDVGSGKTELASTIGDEVARQEDIEITLFPLSLSARGQGRVGEMTKLISSAFTHVKEEAKKLKSDDAKQRGGIILLVDEADALAQSRESSQMHHEDRAGVNAFIRGIDLIANSKSPAAVIMCTNRLDALDPAIRRRAAEILEFRRPNSTQRHEVLEEPLVSLGFSAEDINRAVQLTGETEEHPYPFTYSDLVQRVIPGIVSDAYPHGPVKPERALELVATMKPTPPFQQQ